MFAKVRTVGLPDLVNGGLVDNESLGGYMEVKPGHFHVFYLVNGARAGNVNEALVIFDNVNDISAILQQESPHEEGGAQSD